MTGGELVNVSHFYLIFRTGERTMPKKRKDERKKTGHGKILGVKKRYNNVFFFIFTYDDAKKEKLNLTLLLVYWFAANLELNVIKDCVVYGSFSGSGAIFMITWLEILLSVHFFNRKIYYTLQWRF